jgi:hypothetical protein
MSCINSNTAARIRARIIKNEALLEKAEAALALSFTHIKEYRLDTGEGSQKTEYKDPRQLQQVIDSIESSLERDYRRLNGTGLVNMNLRRKHYFRRG